MGMMFQKYLPSLFAFFALCLPCVGSQRPSSGTAPFIFDGNRVYAELALVRPDGTLHKVLAFVDLGSPSTILSEALFKELQLDQQKRCASIPAMSPATPGYLTPSVTIAEWKRFCLPVSCRNIRS